MTTSDKCYAAQVAEHVFELPVEKRYDLYSYVVRCVKPKTIRTRPWEIVCIDALIEAYRDWRDDGRPEEHAEALAYLTAFEQLIWVSRKVHGKERTEEEIQAWTNYGT